MAGIVDIALSQEGTKEASGNNDVKYNDWYYGRHVSGGSYLGAQYLLAGVLIKLVFPPVLFLKLPLYLLFIAFSKGLDFSSPREMDISLKLEIY